MTKNGGNKDQAMYVQLKVKLQSLTTIYFSTFTMSNCAFLLTLSDILPKIICRHQRLTLYILDTTVSVTKSSYVKRLSTSDTVSFFSADTTY